jgi:hypothetical protein
MIDRVDLWWRTAIGEHLIWHFQQLHDIDSSYVPLISFITFHKAVHVYGSERCLSSPTFYCVVPLVVGDLYLDHDRSNMSTYNLCMYVLDV